MNDLNDVLQGGFCETLLSYDILDWFVNEVRKIDNYMGFFFKNTNKDMLLTEEDEQTFDHINICLSCETSIKPNKVRDQCLFTGKYTTPVTNKHKLNVTQKRISFYPIIIK